jgi:hypothetical protein
MLESTKASTAIGIALLSVSISFVLLLATLQLESGDSPTRFRAHLAYRHGRKVFPEGLQRLYAAKQCSEDCGVRQQDVSGALGRRRHPDTGVEFGVPGFDERMRSFQIDGLPRKDVD